MELKRDAVEVTVGLAMKMLSGRHNEQERQTHRIFLLGMMLFALGGVVTGFTLGTISFSRGDSLNTAKSVLTLPERATETPLGKVMEPIPLGCPSIDQYANTAHADGYTHYTVKVHAVDKSSSCGTGKAIHAPAIVAKLWLIHRLPEKEILLFPDEQDKLASIDTLASPLTGRLRDKDDKFPEIPGLQFDSQTPQLQTTNENGDVQWQFTIPPGVQPGEYDLLVLTDWNGRYFSWSWVNIDIRQAVSH